MFSINDNVTLLNEKLNNIVNVRVKIDAKKMDENECYNVCINYSNYKIEKKKNEQKR